MLSKFSKKNIPDIEDLEIILFSERIIDSANFLWNNCLYHIKSIIQQTKLSKNNDLTLTIYPYNYNLLERKNINICLLSYIINNFQDFIEKYIKLIQEYLKYKNLFFLDKNILHNEWTSFSFEVIECLLFFPKIGRAKRNIFFDAAEERKNKFTTIFLPHSSEISSFSKNNFINCFLNNSKHDLTEILGYTNNKICHNNFIKGNISLSISIKRYRKENFKKLSIYSNLL